MKKPILIVRTVSIEKLSAALEGSRSKWPEHPLWVITLPGREGELLADGRVDDVLLYASPSGTFCERLELGCDFEAVVFPLGNKNGWGYANVYRTFSWIRTQQVYLMPYCQSLRQVSPVGLQGRALIELMLQRLMDFVAWFLTLPLVKQALTRPSGLQVEQKLDLVDQDR